MVKLYRLSFSIIAFFSFALIPALAAVTSKNLYPTHHTLGEDYKFDPRDGWKTTEVTDLPYKYHNSTSSNKRSVSKRDHSLDSITGVISHVWQGMKPFGDSTSCIITWYTGHDLKNPSCWANSDWSPTDKSFACATTLHGWEDSPKCFDFLEICNGHQCTFARVVDSCAGCKRGSRHIDLTRAAFNAIANENEGVKKVKFRQATKPKKWNKDLWGPESE